MPSFFTLPASERKRKRSSSNQASAKRVRQVGASAPSKRTPKRAQRDESISGSDSDGQGDSEATTPSKDSSDTSEKETGAEQRLQLAQNYLENIKSEVREEIGFDAADVDRDLIAERLNEDVAVSKGRLYRHIASTLDFESAIPARFPSHDHCTTSIATCSPFAYTVTKTLVLTKWKIPSPPTPQPRRHATQSKIHAGKVAPPIRRRPTKLISTCGSRTMYNSPSYDHHTGPILCVAASSDGRFVATGGVDKRIIIWDASNLKALKAFTQHRDAVTGLVFRRGTNQLYSSSADRTIKSWSLDELAYVETLFGHQDQVVDVAALSQERCLSAGSRDRTVRLWKVIEETQLVFRGGGLPTERRTPSLRQEKVPSAFAEGSIDRVALIDDETFVTGSDNGTLALWSIHKKKPVFQIPSAHGQDPPPSLEETFTETELVGRKVPSHPQPRWITALAVIPYSDVVFSGSWDGFIRAWMITGDKKRLEFVAVIGRAEQRLEDATTGETTAQNNLGSYGEAMTRGVINDLDIFEWGDGGKGGLCVVAAMGREHRLGKWKKVMGGEGAIVFQIPKK